MLTEVEIEALIESREVVKCSGRICPNPAEWRVVFDLECGHGSYLTCTSCRDAWIRMHSDGPDYDEWLCPVHIGWFPGRFIGLYPWG